MTLKPKAIPSVPEMTESVAQAAFPKGNLYMHMRDELGNICYEGPDALLRELQQAHPEKEAIANNLAYLEKRRAQMQYPRSRAQGWPPIGSGIVESGNKLVVEARLKGSGMHWADRHVNPMLALRNVICSGRWKQEWPKIEARLRQQAGDRRTHLHRSRTVELAVGRIPPKPLEDVLIRQPTADQMTQTKKPKKP
jgi:hypothetical protein